MKNTKKIVLTVLALALVLSTLLGLMACNVEPKKGTEVVITLDSNVMADITGKSLADYMAALEEKGEFTYVASKQSWGLFVESINGRTADSKTEYWAVYTDDADFSFEGANEYEFNGITYLEAGFGVSSIMLKEGKSYLFVLTPLA